MTLTLKWATAVTLLAAFTGNTIQQPTTKEVQHSSGTYNPQPKIQAAILLDVSNSMDGLIEQAKAQLWNMVSIMGKAKCDAVTPQIEIALYEYGSPRNDVKQGYVKQVSAFTTDLDGLSGALRGRDHLVAVGHGQGHRLLAEDVLPRLQRAQG